MIKTPLADPGGGDRGAHPAFSFDTKYWKHVTKAFQWTNTFPQQINSILYTIVCWPMSWKELHLFSQNQVGHLSSHFMTVACWSKPKTKAIPKQKTLCFPLNGKISLRSINEQETPQCNENQVFNDSTKYWYDRNKKWKMAVKKKWCPYFGCTGCMHQVWCQ